MDLHDAYEVLGLSRDAGPAEVKAAYRARIVKAHPDHGGDAATFIRVRAAYEILSAYLHEPIVVDEVPIPAELRSVIDALVRAFREQQDWARQETHRRLDIFSERMSSYIVSASRGELRTFSTTFRNSWDASINALFTKCNDNCDSIMQEYESWYTSNTQEVFDDMYKKELLAFARRRRFWEVFALLGILAVALGWVIAWDTQLDLLPVVIITLAMLAVAFGAAFLVHRWTARRERKVREKVQPLSVVPFRIQEGARFPTEETLRRGRETTAALGVTGLFLGSAVAGGLAVPVAGAVAGAALGGAVDRLFNPTKRMRQTMQMELRLFMQAATPQVEYHVTQAHERLLSEARDLIVENYGERVKGTVRLLTESSGVPGDDQT